MNKQSTATTSATSLWPAAQETFKWCERRNSAQDTSAAETTEVDEMSSEPYHINDTESLTDFFEHDPFPIQGGLEKLDIMDTTGPFAAMEDDDDQQEVRVESAAVCCAEYEQIECLLYGMNKLTINHKDALELARKSPHDPVMIAVQALLHRDENAANELWKRANQLGISSKVERGCGLVQALVGKMLEDGVGGVVKDSLRAAYWYSQAAKKGYACAQCFLGLFHVKASEYDKAYRWLGRAARQGHARAQMHYGLLFEHGRVDKHGRRDFVKAKEWYKLASDRKRCLRKNCRPSLCCTVFLHFFRITEGDTKAACRLGYVVRRSNHRDGFFDAGYLTSDDLMDTTGLGDGLTMSSNKSQGQSSYEPINIGTSLFVNTLGSLYDSEAMVGANAPAQYAFERRGNVGAFQKDTKRASLKEENEDVIAVKSLWQEQPGSSKKRRLDHMTAPSAVGRSNFAESLALPFAMQDSLKSLEIMDAEENPNAQLYDSIETLMYGLNKTRINHLSALEIARRHPNDPVMICIQALLQRDEEAANTLWKKANELGISSKVELGGGLVQALVGKMLEHGLGGVKENLRRAEFWYTQSAGKKDHATAQYFLGLFHIKDGEYDRARYWLDRAARQGHARAQMHFGLLYEHSRDFQTAKFWYTCSAAQGDAKAECRLDFVEGKRRQGTIEVQSQNQPLSRPKAAQHPLSPRSTYLPHTLMQESKQKVEPDICETNSSSAMDSTTTDSFNPQSSSSSVGLLAAVSSPEPKDDLLKPRPSSEIVKIRIAEVLPPDVIKPYCAVLGDKSTRGARLTVGTKVLREMKEWFRENRISYQEAGRESQLFEEALSRYYGKMSELFEDYPTERETREQTILVKCTKKSLESSRVAKPNCYRYSSETQCQYGTAMLPHAVLFYFDSRDPPKLDAEVTKYRRKLGARLDLQGKRRAYFETYLEFCAATANQAADGCPSAQLAIESTNFIPALKKLWEDLERTIGS